MPSVQLEKKVPEGFLERLACNVFRTEALSGPAFFYSGEGETVLAFSPAHVIRAQGNSRLEKIRRYAEEVSGEYMVPWIGGVGFTAEKARADEIWAGFPNAFFFLPKYYFHQREQILSFVYSSPLDLQVEEVGGEYNRILRLVVKDVEEKPAPKCSLDLDPAHPPENWLKLCEAIDAAMLAGDVQKVVPAQVATGKLSHFEVGALIERLNAYPRERLYKFALRHDRDVFIGATPELLFRQLHQDVFIPALAGTRRRDTADPAKDAEIGRELLGSAKELREHAYVVDFIRTQLAKLGAELPAERPPELLELPTLWHLYTPHAVQVKDAHPLELLETLHPTPAVAGTPQDAAAKLLAGTEGFNRGLFAAPLGFFSATHQEARFLVGLRGVLLQEKPAPAAHFFAGAGYVRGSDPALEWRETCEKIGNARQLFDK